MRVFLESDDQFTVISDDRVTLSAEKKPTSTLSSVLPKLRNAKDLSVKSSIPSSVQSRKKKSGADKSGRNSWTKLIAVVALLCGLSTLALVSIGVIDISSIFDILNVSNKGYL